MFTFTELLEGLLAATGLTLQAFGILAVVLIANVIWWTAPYLSASLDRRRGIEGPTTWLTLEMVGKVIRDQDIPWQTHKLIAQARVRRVLAEKANR